MNIALLDLDSDYLISSYDLTPSAQLPRILQGAISHDRITRFLSVDVTRSQDLWQMPEPAVNESPIDACTGCLDAVTALQVPGYSLWAKTKDLSELEDLFDGLGGQRLGIMQRDQLLGYESSCAIFRKDFLR